VNVFGHKIGRRGVGRGKYFVEVRLRISKREGEKVRTPSPLAPCLIQTNSNKDSNRLTIHFKGAAEYANTQETKLGSRGTTSAAPGSKKQQFRFLTTLSTQRNKRVEIRDYVASKKAAPTVAQHKPQQTQKNRFFSSPHDEVLS
jgi:hypothetical protein